MGTGAGVVGEGSWRLYTTPKAMYKSSNDFGGQGHMRRRAEVVI